MWVDDVDRTLWIFAFCFFGLTHSWFLADRCRCLPFGMDFFSRIKPWCVGGLPPFFLLLLVELWMEWMVWTDRKSDTDADPTSGRPRLMVGEGGEEVRRTLQCVKSE